MDGPCKVEAVVNFETKKYEAIVILARKIADIKLLNTTYYDIIFEQAKIDKTVEKEGCLLPLNVGGLIRLAFIPVHTDDDTDDVRSYADAATKAIKRVVAAGGATVLLAVVPEKRFPQAALVTLLGALEASYVPIQYREAVRDKPWKLSEIGFYAHGQNTNDITNTAVGLEKARFVARDLGGADPERMAPPKFAQYVKQTFEGSKVSVEIIDNVKTFETEYPMFAAVNRAAHVVERHRGRVIFLNYTGAGPITQTLGLVGKGVTYDTGGADIKAGGIMAGMSRDKCGAAAVVGFFKALNHFAPKGIKAFGALAVCRNSVGEDCYVADEVITSRAGVRLRVGNTDAEGRMVMTDLLCKLKELVAGQVNPHLFTIATLTGHCCNAVGTYTAVLDNGPAKAANSAQNLQTAGEDLGEGIEVSTLRREDYKFVKTTNDGDADLLQCNNKPSSQTPRGHQFPAAFMVLASGLDKFGLKSNKPIKYTHIDIAGSSGHLPDTPTGTPILALANFTFGDELKH